MPGLPLPGNIITFCRCQAIVTFHIQSCIVKYFSVLSLKRPLRVSLLYFPPYITWEFSYNVTRELHQDGLEEAAGGSKPYLNPATLEEEHRRLVAAALQLFTAGGNSILLKQR